MDEDSLRPNSMLAGGLTAFLFSAMRLVFVAFASLAFLSACGTRQEVFSPSDSVPLGQRLNMVAAQHNAGQYDALRTQFARNATIQLPATPRGATIDTYIRLVKADPYTIAFDKQEFVYSQPGRATTRTKLAATSPGRFNLNEVVTIDWVLEDGAWRIARIAVADWPPIVGTWRRGGLRGEGSLELRVLPGNLYVVYAGEDYAVPAFRGSYTLQGNKITFTDSSAEDSSKFSSAPGTYSYVQTANGINLRIGSDENPWRNARFDGDWNTSR